MPLKLGRTSQIRPVDPPVTFLVGRMQARRSACRIHEDRALTDDICEWTLRRQ